MPRKQEEPWYQRVAEIMVREGRNIRQAADECDLRLAPEELISIERNKTFQRVLWTERHRFYNDLAKDPTLCKQSLIGQMMFLIQKLIEEGEYDKALTGGMQLAKVQGFVGPEQQVNIFGGVTPKDLDEARKAIVERLKGTEVTNGASISSAN